MSSRRDDRMSRDRYSQRSSSSHSSNRRPANNYNHNNRRNFFDHPRGGSSYGSGNRGRNNDFRNNYSSFKNNDRRDRDRRTFNDSNKFHRNEHIDNRRSFGNSSHGQERRFENPGNRFGRPDNRRGIGGLKPYNSFEDRRRNTSYGSRGENRRGSSFNRHPMSRPHHVDSDRMPPPNRRFGGTFNKTRIGGSFDKFPPRRFNNLSTIGAIKKPRVDELRRKLAEKHAGRKINPSRELLAKKLRLAKMRSTLTNRRITTLPGRRLKSAVNRPLKKPKEEKEESWDDEMEKEINEEEKAAKTNSESEENSEMEEEEKTKVKTEKETPKKEKAEPKEKKGNPIKVNLNLECIHCKSKCLTVKEYTLHLSGRAHFRAMQRVALRQRAQLSRLKLEQRQTQKEIDENLEDARSNYCRICMLRHKQTTDEHAASEDHRSIQKFLRPYCSICKIRFRRLDPFEHHRCSIAHLRRKAIMEKTGKTVEEVDECEVDLEKFTTVDEVGEDDDDVGSDEDAGDEHQDDEENESKSDSDEVEIANEEINVGADHIKLVQANYCEICYTYISHRGDVEVNLKRHCSSQQHLRLYIRYKDDLMLKEEAAAMHKKREAEKKKREKEAADRRAAKAAAAAEKAAEATETAEETEKKEEKELNGSKADESEIWDALNQDIGELIHDDDEVETKDDGEKLKQNGEEKEAKPQKEADN